MKQHIARICVSTSIIMLLAAAAPAPDKFDETTNLAKAQMLANPALAMRLAASAQALAEKQPATPSRSTEIATAEWLQAEAAIRIGRTEHASKLIEQALRRLDQTKASKLLGDLIMSRGGVFSAEAHTAEALADYQYAHSIFSKAGEARSQSIALVTIGSLYQNAQDFENALKYYSRALDIYRGDVNLEMSIVNNRGGTLQDLKRYDEAAAQFRRALAIARFLKSSQLESQVQRNLARVWAEKGELAEAERAIQRGLAAAGSSLATAQPHFDAVSAYIALKKGQVARARTFIERSFAGVDLTATGAASREAHYTAYEIYRRLGDETKALAHLQAMKRLDDQVWKLTASTNTALMAARFDSANQEARIAKLKADDAARQLAMAQAETRFQFILFAGIGSAALIVLGLLGFGLWQSRRARVRLSASNTALEKALAAKTEFLATTSHEIRTPLNGILGMTQVLLADPRLDAAARDRVGIVHGAGLTMRGLVDDILDVAKMEAGNLTVEEEPFDLNALLADVTRIWGEQARAKGLEFHLELADCPRGILGDAGRVRQVIYNLLSNAVKFTARGSITVQVACGGDRLRIAVADTGIGIAPDKHDEIFESFKQADGGTTRQFGGTGLGLAIVRNIATAMGGRVEVDSALGAGATFTIELPLERAEIAAAPATTAADAGVLIVDRNPISRAMLKAVLDPRAAGVTLVGSCAEAIAALNSDRFARVLIDEATASADDADPIIAVGAVAAAAGAPVAVLWPTPDEAARAALTAAGIAQVIAKPIAGPALAAAFYGCNTPQDLVSAAA